MTIKSTSIADYIELNYDIEIINDQKDLERVEELVINNLNYSLEQAPFYPNELIYFKNLKRCTFMNFEITDEIVEILNNLNLQMLTLDNCVCLIDTELNIEKIYIEVSKISLSKIKAKELTIIECGTINIKEIENTEILTILNCNIINSKLLEKIKCRIEGSTLDDETVTKLENITYTPKQYKKII